MLTIKVILSDLCKVIGENSERTNVNTGFLYHSTVDE